MEIKGKVHCLFEQSGTFKREFIKLGIPAEDYDLKDDFGETDNVVDLFAEIENAYRGGASLFDNVGKDDFILAFFPCIYFCDFSQMMFSLTDSTQKGKISSRKIANIISRNEKRSQYFETLVKFCGVCLQRNIRMVFENPRGQFSFLNQAFLKSPSIVDNDRTTRGDLFRKPTSYWYFNCEPPNKYFAGDYPKNLLYEKIRASANKEKHTTGECSKHRSSIQPEYARNFINDFILGTRKENHQLSLF